MHNNQDDELDAIFAAGDPFAGKNSRLERSMRARLQLRDRKGRFIYMGGGLSSIFRKRDGSLVNTIGRSVGASNKDGFAQLMVEDSSEGIEAGVYDVPAGNSQVAQAILPGTPSSVPYTGSATSSDIIDFDSVERRDAPLGWTKNDDGSFSSEDGEWSIVRDDKGRWTTARNGKPVEGDSRDAASAITRATAIDAEDTADEETKKRVATLREEGADQDAIDKVLFNAEEKEDLPPRTQIYFPLDEQERDEAQKRMEEWFENRIRFFKAPPLAEPAVYEPIPKENWAIDNRAWASVLPKGVYRDIDGSFRDSEGNEWNWPTEDALEPVSAEDVDSIEKFTDEITEDTSVTELQDELDRAKRLYDSLASELPTTENGDKESELVENLLILNEGIGSLEDNLAEKQITLGGQDGEDSVESIKRRLKRLEGRAQARFNRGEDTEDLDKQIADLEQQLEAQETVGEKDGGAKPAAGGEGATPPSDGGNEGTVPDELGGDDARGPRVERRGDTLRDSDGNVIAQKVSEPLNAEEIKERGFRVAELFELDPEYASVFRESLIEAMKDHPQGASVTIHDEDYYKQPGVRMFLTQDGKGGITLNGDEIVSGFMAVDAADANGGAVTSMISKMVELGGRRLDAFDTRLPQLYARNGFKPVARLKWNDEYIPTVENGAAKDWDKKEYKEYNNGEPDVVFMTYDPERMWSEYDPTEGEYVDEYDQGTAAQESAVQPVTEEVVTKDLTDRQKAAQARRQAAQEANDALAGENGLLEGEVPSNSRGGVNNQNLQLAPIGQVVEATSRNGRKRRFIKVGRDTWKRADKPDDKKRYRSYELRGGKANFVQRTDADIPSVDEVRGPVDRYRPKPFSFPRNASNDELMRLRQIYMNQAETDDNAGGALRAEETVRLIDRAIARLQGEPVARRRPAADRRAEDQRAGRSTEPANMPSNSRGVAPLLEENDPAAGPNTAPYEPTQDMPEGTTDDPEQLAQMYDTISLEAAYREALANGEDTIRIAYPGPDGEPGPEANVPIEAVRDTLQRLGVNTNEIVSPEASRESDDIEGRPVPDWEYGTNNNRSEELGRLYQTLQELNAGLVNGTNGNLTKRQLKKIMRQRKSVIRRIRRLEDKGFRSTYDVNQVDLSNFSWDDTKTDTFVPNLVMKALQEKYPEAKVLPNGDLVVASNKVTDSRGKERLYEVIITRTDDDMFYPYIRETRLAEQNPDKRYRSMRFGVMRHSARAVNNQVIGAIERINNSGGADWNISSWFNDTARRKKEGNPARLDTVDENGEPVHEKYRVFTQEAVTKILNAVDSDAITDEMVITLYNYIGHFGNGEETAATLYSSFGLDINTMNKFIDAVNVHIDERYTMQRFSTWHSNNGIPLAEGDMITYVGNKNQPGNPRLMGRRGIIEVRPLEYDAGNEYIYTDYVYVRWVDENGVPLGTNYEPIPAMNLRLDKTSGGTDGSERVGPNAMTVPLPRLTTRAINRYAGRGKLRNIQPYISEFDRNTMAGPQVTIDGKQYPVQSSRGSIISENMEKIGANPADLKVGDFLRTYEDGTVRLNEVVGIEELEDGGRIVHTVMPINISSGRVASTEFPAGVGVELDVYRERVPEEETPVDPNAPGLSNGQVARLAEVMRGVDQSRLNPETLARINEMVSAPDPAQLPYNQNEFTDTFLEALEAEADVADLQGQVTPEEASRIIEQMIRRAAPDPAAANELETVRRAGLQRAGELNGLPTSSYLPGSPTMRPQSGMSDIPVDMGPAVNEYGVVQSPDWVDTVEDGAILSMLDRGGEKRNLIRKNGFWVEASYGIDNRGLIEGETAWSDDDIRGFIGVSSSQRRRTLTTPVTEEEIQRFKEYAAGTLNVREFSNEDMKSAFVDQDITLLDAMFAGDLFGNGEKKYGAFHLQYRSSGFDSNETYTDYSEHKYNVSAAIVNDDGEVVGNLYRYVTLNADGELRVVHALMKIEDEKNKNSGFSQQYSAASEELYKELGFGDIYVQTAWDGSYVWARAGYGWNFVDYDKMTALGRIPSKLRIARDELRASGNESDAAKLDDILNRFDLDTDDPNFPTPYEIASLKKDGESGTSWGRELMTNSGWFGVKRLGDFGKTGEQIAAERNAPEAAAPDTTPEAPATSASPNDFEVERNDQGQIDYANTAESVQEMMDTLPAGSTVIVQGQILNENPQDAEDTYTGEIIIKKQDDGSWAIETDGVVGFNTGDTVSPAEVFDYYGPVSLDRAGDATESGSSTSKQPSPQDFTTGPSADFDGWDVVDGPAWIKANKEASLAEAIQLLDSRNLPEEEHQVAVQMLTDIFLDGADGSERNYFALGNNVVSFPKSSDNDQNIATAMSSLTNLINTYPSSPDSPNYRIEFGDVHPSNPNVGGRFMPGMDAIEYFLTPSADAWLRKASGASSFFTPDVKELFTQNDPEETLNKFLTHIVAHEYGHLIDSNYSNENQNMRTLFREELDRAGLLDQFGTYPFSYEDVETPVGGNVRNSEFFAEAFAQMASEDISGASPTPLGELMREFLKKMGVTQ